jgi:hypothetical protein
MKMACPLSALLVLFSAVACHPSATGTTPSAQPTVTAKMTSIPSASPTRTATLTFLFPPYTSRTPNATPTKCSPRPIIAAFTKTSTPVPNFEAPPLTAYKLKNGTYINLGSDTTITLVDGIWRKSDHVIFLADYTFGDLDNDGIADAAAAIVENWGGTMFLEYILVVLNRNGEPVQGAFREIAEGTGGASSMKIRRGQIILEERLHARDDCNQCSSIKAVEVMQFLSDGHLVQWRLSTTYLPGQIQREITVTSPAEGTAVSCSVRMQGGVSDYTNENFMYYSIRSMADELLDFGSFTMETNGENPGGTFDVTIDLAMVPAGTSVVVSLYEAEFELTSPDGPYSQYKNAMDSVFLFVV